MSKTKVLEGTLPNGKYRFQTVKRNGFGVWELRPGASSNGDWIAPDNVVKSRNVKVYDLPAGWYRHQTVEVGKCSGCGHGPCPGDGTTKVKVSTYFAVSEVGQYVPVGPAELEHIATMITGPVPGSDGCWNGARCKCGNEVETYDRDGFPRCDACGPKGTGPDAGPVPF
jgi:hypothetical protein